MVLDTSAQEIISADTLIKSSMFDVQRNSISLESNLFFNALNYERLFPLKKNTGIAVGSGIYYRIFGGSGFSVEANLVLGGTKHFLEIGLKHYLMEKNDELTEDWILGKFGVFVNNSGLYPTLSYRYQAVKGFLFKTNLGVYPLDGPMVVPSLSFGYSF